MNGDYSSWDWGGGGQDYSDWGNFSGYGGNTGNNFLSSIWQGLSAPNTWKSIIPLGLAGLSAFGGQKATTPSYAMTPMAGQTSQAANQLLAMANQPVFSQQDIENQLRQLQGIQAQRGLGTIGSGSWNKMLGEQMQNNLLAQKNYQAGLLGQVANIYGQYKPQVYFQQPSNPWYTNAASTYTNLANSANMMRALSPMSTWSWYPWG
jgi:hypothetical protein